MISKLFKKLTFDKFYFYLDSANVIGKCLLYECYQQIYDT